MFHVHTVDSFVFRSLQTLCINRLSRGSYIYRELKDGLPNPRTEYYKFMVVRHPLERLASAYFGRVAGRGRKPWVKSIKVRG